MPDIVPAARAVHLLRRLSEAGAGYVGGLGAATRQQLHHCGDGGESRRPDPLRPSAMFETAGYQLLPVLPELVLAVGAMALLMLGAYRGQGTTALVTALAVCLLILTGVLELMLPAGKLVTFGGSFIVDDFARFLKVLALIGSVATLVLSAEFLSDPSRRIFEYAILVLLSTLGMMVLISAGDLIALYLGLELMSLALYVVATSNRDNAKSTEAGLKYFVLGALSSGMLLYGASLIYGFTGTVSFAGIAA